MSQSCSSVNSAVFALFRSVPVVRVYKIYAALFFRCFPSSLSPRAVGVVLLIVLLQSSTAAVDLVQRTSEELRPVALNVCSCSCLAFALLLVFAFESLGRSWLLSLTSNQAVQLFGHCCGARNDHCSIYYHSGIRQQNSRGTSTADDHSNFIWCRPELQHTKHTYSFYSVAVLGLNVVTTVVYTWHHPQLPGHGGWIQQKSPCGLSCFRRLGLPAVPESELHNKQQ